MKMYMVALVVVVGVLGGFYGGYKVGQNNVSASTSTTGTGSRRQRRCLQLRQSIARRWTRSANFSPSTNRTTLQPARRRRA